VIAATLGYLVRSELQRRLRRRMERREKRGAGFLPVLRDALVATGAAGMFGPGPHLPVVMTATPGHCACGQPVSAPVHSHVGMVIADVLKRRRRA
jgi:hypothetical protein